MNKIHYIDWKYRTEKELTTCSHDATVKFWDVQMHREPPEYNKDGDTCNMEGKELCEIRKLEVFAAFERISLNQRFSNPQFTIP